MSNFTRVPGLIDIHVHLRDPGETHKEDFYNGTCSALAGGVTAVFDMPNNIEPIFTLGKLKEKEQIAKNKAVCDWGLYFGTDGMNTDQFEQASKRTVGLKLYLSETTGKYVVGEKKKVDLIFEKWPKEKILVVHAEKDRVDLSIEMAAKYGNKLHITHVSTRESLRKIISAKSEGLNITCDTAPQYLLLKTDDQKRLSGFGKIKPPLATEEDQAYLWKNLDEIDCVASDHAPHTKEEKKSANPPSGMPGLETMLPLLIHEIGVEGITRMISKNPRKIFGIKEDESTYTEVDPSENVRIKNEDLYTKCKWSPYDGWETSGKVKRVFIRGTKVFEDGKILVKPGFGRNVISP